MRAAVAALGLAILAGPASAAVLTAGLDEPFTVDFRGDGGELAAEGVPFVFGPVSAVSNGPGDDNPLVQSGSGIGVGGPGLVGEEDEIDNRPFSPSEFITLTFNEPFLLRSVSIDNAGLTPPFGATGIEVEKNGSPFDTFASDDSNTDGQRTTLVFSGLEQSFGAGDTLRFRAASDFDSYTLTGLTAVPLPAAAWLFGGGLAAIGGYLRVGRGRRLDA